MARCLACGRITPISNLERARTSLETQKVQTEPNPTHPAAPQLLASLPTTKRWMPPRPARFCRLTHDKACAILDPWIIERTSRPA